MIIRRTCILTLLVATPLAGITAARAEQQVVIEGTQISGEPGVMMGRGGLMKTGTARIAGRVLSLDTGTPVRRAQVRLSSPEVGSKSTMTDNDGRFDFKDLPAGRFTVSAAKAGYVNVQYGQTRPFESGRAIELVDKQVMNKADISMPRGGVITGRIVDELGEPVADAVVSTMRQTWTNGRRRLVMSGRTAQTNDLGQFRIYGLSPGEYYVSATLRSPAEMMMIESAMFAARTAAAGADPGPTSGYAATYFPGTTSPANAQRVVVAIGQEAQNTDFALAPVRLARITGTVMTSDGRPLDGALISVMPSSGMDSPLMGLGSAGRSDKNGAFVVQGVAPGDYVLNVRPIRIVTSDGGNRMSFTTTVGGPGSSGAESEMAAVPVSVTGDDVSNVLILTSKGATAIGVHS